MIFGEVLDGKDVILSMETLAVFERPHWWHCRGTCELEGSGDVEICEQWCGLDVIMCI